ncbi:YDG domain-containing protein, partial [Pantoea sp. 18069]|uniref:YDG domain-containing protein n=1 Tax=Pantoea sp. 18069 TaxID=2681415 RepID=UPI00190FA6F8
GSFADRNAGTGKTVTVSGTLGGEDAHNYALTHNATTTASIERLAIGGEITASDKVYDGALGASTSGTLGAVLGN